MAPLPAQSRAYFTRGNIPFNGKTTTQLEIESYYAWVLARCLLDIEVSGTAYGTRHHSTVWMCRGSGNQVSSSLATLPGVQGVFIWPTQFTGSLVRGTNTVRHHWALFENTATGYELLLNLSNTDGNLSVTIGITGSFGGSSSTSQMPTASLAANVVSLGNTAWEVTNAGHYAMFGGTTTFGGQNYVHFTCAASASADFHFCMSRPGLDCFTSWIAAWRTSGTQVGDNRYNMFTLAGTTTATGRGTPSSSNISAAAFVGSRQVNGQAKSAGGILCPTIASTQFVMLQSVDSIDGKYNAEKMEIGDLTPNYTRRGVLPDLYMVGTGPVGGSIPTTSAQERIIIGDMIVPWTGSVPLI